MDCFHQGKQQLDREEIDQAECSFKNGFHEGDIRCAYGLLAVNALRGTDCSPSLFRMKAVWPDLLEMAEAGDGDANFIIGRCYETGSAVEANVRLAMKYYTRSANKNNLDAMYNLGCIYTMLGESGRIIARDYFESAAKQGHYHAQLALGHYYEEKGNEELSRFWYSKANEA